MDPLRLFGSRLSPFVEKVVRGLARKKLEYELVPISSPLDFRRWSPQTGKMPVLEIEGDRVYDSTFILRRLDERFPEPPFYAQDPAVAAAQRLLEDWSDESLYWYAMAVRWSDRNRAATTEQLAGTLPALFRPLARLVLPRQLGGMARAQGLGRLPYETVLVEYGRRLDELVLCLGESPYFHAEEPSGADLAIHGQLRGAQSGPTPELAELVAHRPALLQWMERVESACPA